MTIPFELHERLAADTSSLGELPLSRLLMSRDGRYPWFLLVPRIAGLRELHELDDAGRHRLSDESAALSRALLKVFGGDKLNVAAIGNLVPQLHLHHVVRFADDDAWPAPVWGHSPPLALADDEAQRRRQAVSASLRAAGIALRTD